MMTETPPPPDQKPTNLKGRSRAQAILYANGVIALLLGAAALSMPDMLHNLFGLDKNISMYIGIALMIMGGSDFLIARFLFANKDRR